MSRSSIFSSDSYAEFRPRVPWTVLGVALVIVLMELGLRSLSEEFIPPPHSRLGIFHWFETDVIPRCAQPRVLIMGSSRAADGVTPRFLDEALQLPEGSTLNLGLQAGTGFDALLFYQRNRERFRQVQLMVINVDEWQFTSKMGPGYRYGVSAPWEERWRFSDGAEPFRHQGEEDRQWELRCQDYAAKLEQRRNGYLLDGVFYSRSVLHYLPRSISVWLGKKKRVRVLDENAQVRLAKLEVGPEAIEASVFTEQLHDFYGEFDQHPLMIGHLEQLVGLAKSDGVRVVLLQMPNRRAYQKEADRLFKAEYDAQRDRIHELARRHGVPVFCFRYPEECGLGETDFADYGHMAVSGSRKLTAFLGQLIREKQILSTGTNGITAVPAHPPTVSE